MGYVYAGIDFGGMSVKVGLFAGEGGLLVKHAVPTSKEDGYEGTVAKTAEAVWQAMEKAGIPRRDLQAAGLGSPGVVDGKKGVVVRWSNYDWYDRPFAADLKNLLGVPVYITNDANAAALGEAKFGASRQFESSILITLGTGVGSGIIFDGKIYEGTDGAGTEAGHMVIVSGGYPCTCGRRGCFEVYSSARALIRLTRDGMTANRDSLMWSFAEDLDKVSGRTAFQAARGKDAAGQAVVDSYISYLADGIANLVNILRPEAVLIGGGVSNEGEGLLGPLRPLVYERLLVSNDIVPLAIEKAVLGNDAGIYGAFALASGSR